MGLLWGFVWFIAGTIFALYVVQAFAAILPGPSLSLTVIGMKPPAGSNPEKCIAYMLTFAGSGKIEHMLVRLWFPNKVEDYKVGLPEEAVTPSGAVAGLIFALGKTPDGRCEVKADVESGEVQVSAAGNRVTIQCSKLPDTQKILGFVATSDTASLSTNAITKMEGFYEYVKLGQTVRKKLPITFTGIKPLENS